MDISQLVQTEAERLIRDSGAEAQEIEDTDWCLPSLLFHSAPGAQPPVHNLRLSNQAIKDAFMAARESSLLPDYEPTGPSRFCYENVSARIEKAGGTMATGWQLSKSAMGGAELEAHAVWRSPDGRLVESTEGEPNWRFFESPRIKSFARGIIVALEAERAIELYSHFSTCGYRVLNIVENPLYKGR